MFYSKIKSVGSYVPQNIVSNEDMSKVVDTNDEWISSRTGIKNRHFSTGESTSNLAAKAAEKILERAGVKAEDIELIVVASVSPDYGTPSTACLVQKKIGAVNAVSFDIGAACSGFIFALSTADKFIKTGVYKNALVLGAEVLSKCLDFTDRGTCVLFGDGAGAVAVRADDTGILGINMKSDGTKGNVLTCGSRTNGNFLLGKKPELGYMTMDGQEVFKFAVRKVPECITQVLDHAGVAAEEIKYFVIHQANYRIIESIAKRLKVSVECFPVNMEHYGNTSAASIPLLLDEINRKGMLKSGDKIVFSGFGAGLTWGAALLEW